MRVVSRDLACCAPRVRRVGAPNGSRGGCGPHLFESHRSNPDAPLFTRRNMMVGFYGILRHKPITNPGENYEHRITLFLWFGCLPCAIHRPYPGALNQPTRIHADAELSRFVAGSWRWSG